MRWTGFMLLFGLVCGCVLFRRTTPMEREMELVRQRHRRKAEAMLADLRARQRHEMEAKKQRLRMEYERRLSKHRAEINKRFNKIVEERKKTYADKPEELRKQLDVVERQRQAALKAREKRIREEYLRKRKAELATLEERHKAEEAALKRRLDLELHKKLAAVRAKYLGKEKKEKAPISGPSELREHPGGEVFVTQYGPDVVRRVKVDTRPALLARRPHQAVVSLMLVPLETEKKGIGKVALAVFFNGKRVKGSGEQMWLNLKRKIENFAQQVYQMPGVVLPEVLVDMIGDIPLKFYDKVLDVSFSAGVKNVRRASVKACYP